MNFRVIFVSLISALLFFWTPATAIAADLVSHASEDARAYIVEPADGATVPQTFTVKFGLSGMDLAPAGVDRENTGHHHLLIDKPELPNLNTSLPASDRVRHFGKAQTETELTLEPGEHTLAVSFG